MQTGTKESLKSFCCSGDLSRENISVLESLQESVVKLFHFDPAIPLFPKEQT